MIGPMEGLLTTWVEFNIDPSDQSGCLGVVTYSRRDALLWSASASVPTCTSVCVLSPLVAECPLKCSLKSTAVVSAGTGNTGAAADSSSSSTAAWLKVKKWQWLRCQSRISFQNISNMRFIVICHDGVRQSFTPQWQKSRKE